MQSISRHPILDIGIIDGKPLHYHQRDAISLWNEIFPGSKPPQKLPYKISLLSPRKGDLVERSVSFKCIFI